MTTLLPFGLLLALAGGLVPGATAPGTPSPAVDADPPAILVLPIDPTPPGGGVLEIRARIVDASGVGLATAYIKKDGAETYTALPMQPSAESADEFVATVTVARGAAVSYYVEATDRAGNGPIANGNPRAPFIVRPAAAPKKIAETGNGKSSHGPPGHPGTRRGSPSCPCSSPGASTRDAARSSAITGGCSSHRSSPRPAPNRSEALEQLCSRTECHPLRGYFRVTRREVMDWLAVLAPQLTSPANTTRPEGDATGAAAVTAPLTAPHPRRRRQRDARTVRRAPESIPTAETAADRDHTDSARDRWGNRARRAEDMKAALKAEASAVSPGSRKSGKHEHAPDLPAAADDSPLERLDEEIFWIQLFEPVLALPKDAAAKALADLASKPLDHPRGRRLFDMRTLRTWLDWARANDPRIASPAALAREREIDPSLTTPGPRKPRPGRGSEGTSLLELLAVLAILGLVVGVTAINLRPLDAPVRTGGQLLRSLLEDTRARAIATTTVHRVRPLTDNTLIVEHAVSCASGTWTLDPDRELELPRGVLLADTLWSVCYSSRGLASQNIVVRLDHDDYPSEQLEILAGGAVRTLQ